MGKYSRKENDTIRSHVATVAAAKAASFLGGPWDYPILQVASTLSSFARFCEPASFSSNLRFGVNGSSQNRVFFLRLLYNIHFSYVRILLGKEQQRERWLGLTSLASAVAYTYTV